ncbi:MAG: dethiobiotin synthase [Desulfuromonadia bacterium]
MGKGRGIFITGTDTGVGKSIVAAVLATLLHHRGIRVGVMKPVSSGCRMAGGELLSDDAHLLASAIGEPVTDAVAPYRLTLPIAPSAAAERDGVTISFERIREALETISATHDFVIVEGAGGLMVPLRGGFLVSDLVRFLQLPLLVVARPDLGTVNHTLLTCFAARQMGLDLRGIVINRFPTHPDEAEKTAPHLIDSLSGAPLLGRFPSVGGETDKERVTRLADILEHDPTIHILIREICRG